MEPRLVFRTHYQVEEPAYMEFLVRCCTSPIKSAYPERVAARLKQHIETRCRTRFNIAASRYAIDLARALGLVTPNNTWTDKGHLVSLIAQVNGGEPEEQLSLNVAEKLLHFRLFLEADGAAFIYIARFLGEHGELAHSEAISSSFVEDMFIHIFSTYLSVTSNPAQRVALRTRIDELQSRGYGGRTGLGKTRQHKLRIHMQTLYRLGLLERLDGTGGIVYRLPDRSSQSTRGLESLLCELPDILAMEERIASREWPEIGAKILGIPYTFSAQLDEVREKCILAALIHSYQQVMSLGTPICSLSAVIESAQITGLTERGWLVHYTQIIDLLREEQKKNPRDIQFHVDRRGRPAFIELSAKWMTTVDDQSLGAA